MDDATALTYGQLSVLRSIRGEVDGTFSTVSWVIDLPAPADPDQVRAGLAALQRRHEGLRTIFVLAPGTEPLQAVLDDAELPVSVRPLAADSPAARAGVLAELAAVPFAVTRAPGWRAAVITVAGRAVAVAVAIHHLLADGWATTVLTDELLRLVQDGDRELPPAPTPRALARRQRSESWDFYRSAFEDYWSAFWAHPDRVPAAGPAAFGPRTVGSVRLRWSAADVDKLAESLDVLPAALWIAVAMTGWQGVRPTASLSATLMSSNRLDHEWDGLVASQNQIVPIGLDVQPGQVFADVVAAIQDLTAEAALASCFDTDEVCRRLGVTDLGEALDYWVNVMVGDFGSPGADPGVVTWKEITYTSWPRHYWRILVEDAVTVQLAFDPDALSKDAAERLLLGWDRAFDRMAADSERRLSAVLEVFGPEPTP